MRKFSKENLEILVRGAEMFHVKHFENSIEKFNILYNELLIWNEKFNLTAIVDEREIIIKHFLDSLSLANFFDFDRNIRMIDLGTGAGFPGLPLLICFPKVKLFLNDSNGKKVSFLRFICQRLFGSNPPEILYGRAEELLKKEARLSGSFQAVTARAVSKPEGVIPLALRYLETNGSFLAQFGPKEDMVRINVLLSQTVAKIKSNHKFSLPFSDYLRQITEIKKCSNVLSVKNNR